MKFLLNNTIRLFFVIVLMGTHTLIAQDAASKSTRDLLVKAILSEGDQQKELIRQIGTAEDAELSHKILTAWKAEAVYVHNDPSGAKIPFIVENKKGIRIDNGQEIDAPTTTVVSTSSALRKSISTTLTLLNLAVPDPRQRISAVNKMGMTQKADNIAIFQARLAKETDSSVKRALNEAIAITQLADASVEVQIKALDQLAALSTLSSMDMVKIIAADASNPERQAVAKRTLAALESHLFRVDLFGTVFRGISLGSVLLIAALGLAITFGLMGVINMAHGELIAVGAYSVYVMQNWCGDKGLEYYFILAIPFAFINAALVGLLLERTVIRFLYQRPLESLLATWGVSLVLQQIFRFIFGANNVNVSSPSWLSGNFALWDIAFTYSRVFVILFAILIIFLTYLLLTKTPLGLLIRAVMQNREMASCVGVRTQRVNMMTFAFGSGLAGLAGAFLSQIGNVGPLLGQTYIIDCFMTVVVGGVGNIIGTVCSAFTIGVSDQTLQQLLGNPVMGKIWVLVAIILFLQMKPGGLFPTKGRGLED